MHEALMCRHRVLQCPRIGLGALVGKKECKRVLYMTMQHMGRVVGLSIPGMGQHKRLKQWQGSPPSPHSDPAHKFLSPLSKLNA
jgi:hypothetical protein